MRKFFTLYAPALLAALVLLAMSPLGTWAQTYTSLNYFEQCAAGASTCDNVFHIDGTLEFEDKATNIDHGMATTNASGYVLVTTNLSDVVTCTLTLNKVGTSGDDPVFLSGIWTTGSATLEIQAWKHNGTDPTLTASATASSVAYACFGAD